MFKRLMLSKFFSTFFKNCWILILILNGCKEHDPVHVNTPVAEVDIITIESQDLVLKDELPGRVTAFRISEIRPQVSGLIMKRYFAEGSHIDQGQPLYQIDDAPYRAALKEACNSYVKAWAGLEANRLKVERYQSLIDHHAISGQEYDDAVATFKSSEAECKLNQALIEQAEIDLGRACIRAPISGRISVSYITEGGLVVVNQNQVLATVTQMDPIYIDITQPSTEMLKIKDAIKSGVLQDLKVTEAQVELVLSNGDIYNQMGTLKFKDVTVDSSTGSVTLRAVFPNPEHRLLPGDFVRARLPQGKTAQAILVPQQSVFHDKLGGAYVLCVTKEMKVEKHIVKTERTVGHSWLITSGLKNGDQVITSGFQKIKPNMPVKISNYTSDVKHVKKISGSRSETFKFMFAHRSLN